MSGTIGTPSYDPALHDNHIVALYDTDTRAQAAQDTLVSGGIPASMIQMVGRGTGAPATAPQTGMWGAVQSLFVPDSDRAAYSHAIGHGHAMLVVTPSGDTDRARVIHALEATNPVDFDAKLQEWDRSGYDHTVPHPDYADHAAVATSQPMPASGGSAKGGVAQDTIEVIEERLRVAKREVAAGAVRVRSYIVERPVEQDVLLHEEHVTLDRQAVDQPAGAAAFQERVIEARAVSEEAVIAKEARVVEEIALRTERTERVETVRDTVRHTEVEIEEQAAPAERPPV